MKVLAIGAAGRYAGTERIPNGPLRDGLARMNAHCDPYGFPGGSALVLQAVLGCEPRPVRQYIFELAGDPCQH